MRSWLSKYSRLAMGAGFALSFLLISVIGYSAFGLYQDSKSFLSTLKSADKVSTAQSSKLVADLNKGFGVLKLPIIKQITQFVGLDFTPIQSEITTLAAISPVLLGGDKPMKYLVAFQNSAEARGTGGILGAYAIIELKKGSVKVIETGSNEPLYGSSLEKIPIDVPEEFKRLYGENPAILQNSNLSPHFP